MADSKVTALTENTTVASTDILYLVDDPAGTAVSQKATVANVVAAGQTALSVTADAAVLLDVSAHQIDLDEQAANIVFAGPASGANNEPTFRALVAADLSTVLQGISFANEIKNWPSYVGMDVDLATNNLWWDSVGSPSTAVTMVDVAGESITENYEYCLKVVTDAAGEGLYQRFTYADEPRIKSGRTLSTLWALWCAGTADATLKLVNSDASETAAAAAAGTAWTLSSVENHTLAGSYCDVQITLNGAGTAWAVPLGCNIGAKAVPLPPRGSRYVGKGTSAIANNVDAGGAWVDLDITAQTSNLAWMAFAQVLYICNAQYKQCRLRRNGDLDTGQAIEFSRSGEISVQDNGSGLVPLDDGQVLEYTGSGTAGDTEGIWISVSGWWEWA